MNYNLSFEAEEFEGLPNEEFNFPLTQPTTPARAMGIVSKPCPEPAGRTNDRCVGGVYKPCPAIPDLLCVTSIDGVPFEYVMNNGWIQKGADGLWAVKKRIANHKQRFTPPVTKALSKFLSDMTGLGMPIEAILTGGSLYCRCVSKTTTLSNHSYGDAIDVAGLRWRSPTGVKETLVLNFNNPKHPEERAILRRVNATLRLSFATVLDYHRKDHENHFHCDTNRGKGRVFRNNEIAAFIKEALNLVLKLKLPETRSYTPDIDKALSTFSGRTVAELKNRDIWNKAVDDLFRRVAQG